MVLACYFFYGRKHATLNHYTTDEEIAEPSGRRRRDDDE